MDMNTKLKLACEKNDIEEVKKIISISSKNGTFKSLQLFYEMHKAEEKDYKELTILLAKFSGIQWTMLIDDKNI